MLWWHKNLILGITCMLAWRLKIVRSGVSVFFMNLHTDHPDVTNAPQVRLFLPCHDSTKARRPHCLRLHDTGK